jgi:hypothetical protein
MPATRWSSGSRRTRPDDRGRGAVGRLRRNLSVEEPQLSRVGQNHHKANDLECVRHSRTYWYSQALLPGPTKMKRCTHGILAGGLFGALVAGCVPLLILGLRYLFGDAHPIDRESDFARLPVHISYGVSAGAVVGALAGLASRLPTSGVSFLRCCGVIALAAGVVRLYTAPRPKVSESDQEYLSYVLSFVAAVIVSGILVWVGVKSHRSGCAGRESPQDDLQSDETKASTG